MQKLEGGGSPPQAPCLILERETIKFCERKEILRPFLVHRPLDLRPPLPLPPPPFPYQVCHLVKECSRHLTQGPSQTGDIGHHLSQRRGPTRPKLLDNRTLPMQLCLAGLGMDVMKARAHVQVIFHVAQYYYPETLWRMFVTNAPMVFRMIWSACSMWIHPITRQKIKVLGGKALKELKSHGVEEHQVCMGGSPSH